MWLLTLTACLYGSWPDPLQVYPWRYTPETDLEPYHEVRWETETWTPDEDLESAALYILKAYEHRPGAPLESELHFGLMRSRIPPLDEEDLRLSFVGDVMWVEDNHAAYTEPVHGLLDGDFRVGNLETPTSPNHPTTLSELRALDTLAFNAPPEQLDGLPLDLLQVNNNHSLDMKDEGLTATLSEIEQRGMLHTGANQQVLVEIGQVPVAFLAYTWGLNQRDIETDYELFIVPFGHIGASIDLSVIADQVSGARAAGAAHVVVLLHWGFEYEYYPDPHFMQLARQIIGTGADLIVGHGSHTAQPAEICTVNVPEYKPGVGRCSIRTEDGVPRQAGILYGLGDFGTSTLKPIELKTGLVATVTLGGRGVSGMGWSAVTHTTDDEGRELLVPLSEMTDDPEYAAESARLDKHIGTAWKRVDQE